MGFFRNVCRCIVQLSHGQTTTASFCHNQGAGRRGNASFVDFSCTQKQPRIFMRSTWVQAPSLCRETLQRPLFATTQGTGYEFSGSRPQARRAMFRVRKEFRYERWLGALSETLPSAKIRSYQGRDYRVLWWLLRDVRRCISSIRVRFASLGRENGRTEHLVAKPISIIYSRRNFRMRFTLCQLPSFGTLR